MAGLPTVQVLLDAATNDRSFPHDITAYVSLTAGISVSTRGRTDELSAGQPVTCTMTLDNTDGRFSLGAAFLATGFFAAGFLATATFTLALPPAILLANSLVRTSIWVETVASVEAQHLVLL